MIQSGSSLSVAGGGRAVYLRYDYGGHLKPQLEEGLRECVSRYARRQESERLYFNLITMVLRRIINKVERMSE